MYRSRHLFVLLVVFAVLIALASPAEALVGLVRGVVLDTDEQPIADVRITVTSERVAFTKTLTTDAEGAFQIRFPTNQLRYRFDFLFEKPGYESFSQRIDPSAPRATRREIVLARSRSQVVETHGDLTAVVTGSTSEAVSAFNEGLAAQRADKLGPARAKFEQAIAADPSLAPAHLSLAQVLLVQKEFEAALASSGTALELEANRAEALRVQYSALRALGRNDESDAIAAELEQAEDAAETAVRLYNEGSEAFQAGDRETALATFKRAAELDPTLVAAHHAIATLELTAGNYEVSAAAAEKALSLGSEDVQTLRVLYGAYDALGRFDELLGIAPRLAAVDPEFGGPKLLEQAAELWNRGQTQQAVKLSRLALAVDSTLAKAHYFIGLDNLSQGKNAEARAALEKFIAQMPEDPDATAAKEMLAYIE